MIRPNDLHVRWQYRECINAFRAGCRKIAKQKEESIVDANNLGTFYRHVNQQIKHRGSIGALINSTGEPVTSDCQKADMFNKYFGSVGVIDNGVYAECSN